MRDWTRLLSDRREGDAPMPPRGGEPRTSFQRDYDRVIFSTAFRRLVGKTQVFPLPDNDLVHSRLTHSLEVSCVGRSLGTMVGLKLLDRHPELLAEGYSERSFGDIVAAACLAHDIGNPPFGHAGEDAIGRWFRERGAALLPEASAVERADLSRFEGNAQGFRVLTRLQIPANPGLKLTYATLAAFTKYPQRAPLEGEALPWKKHGFFQAEAPFFAEVAEGTGLERLEDGAYARHPLAFLVEAADDICYSILDLEDGFRLGLVPYAHTRELFLQLARRDPKLKEAPPSSDRDAQKEELSYLRAKAINALATQVEEVFLDLEGPLTEGSQRGGLTAALPSAGALKELVGYTVEHCYKTPTVLEIELAGYEVLSHLLDEFVPAVLAPAPDKRQSKLLGLLPPIVETAPYARVLRVTDHLSGMTDAFAVSLYRRLRGINLPSRI